MQAQQIKQMIEAALPGSQVQVLGDDGQHFDAIVVAEAFAGKSMVQQHQMVYAALGGQMESGAIHALALKTYTPEAWAKAH